MAKIVDRGRTGAHGHEGPSDARERVELPRGVIAPGWRLLRPLPLSVEPEDDGGFVASDDAFALHGDGATRDDAIRDYVQTLIEYHDLLVERAAGNEPTSALLRLLNQYLEK